jgi:hypothetical protein
MISNLEKTIDDLLEEAFPNYNIQKQCCIKISGKTLFFDFCIPNLKVMVEVQGQQHSKFVQFFHGMIDNFNKSVARDDLKREWCSKNIYLQTY